MRFAGFGCALLPLLLCRSIRSGGAAPGTPDTPEREVIEAASTDPHQVQKLRRRPIHQPRSRGGLDPQAGQPHRYLAGFGLLNLTLAHGTITPVFCDTLTFQRDAFGAPISPAPT